MRSQREVRRMTAAEERSWLAGEMLRMISVKQGVVVRSQLEAKFSRVFEWWKIEEVRGFKLVVSSQNKGRNCALLR